MIVQGIKSLFAVVIVMALIAALAPNASADSLGQRAERLVAACNFWAPPDWGAHCLDQNQMELWGENYPYCRNQWPPSECESLARDVWLAGMGAQNTALYSVFYAELGDLLISLVGEVVTQVESLTGLQILLHSDFTKPSVGVGFGWGTYSAYYEAGLRWPCAMCASAGTSNAQPNDGDDSVNNFRFNNTTTLKWSKNSADQKTDAYAAYNLYQQSYRARQEFDYWASSMKASVTPFNGARLKMVKTARRPNKNYIDLTDWSPESVDHYGSAGSMDVGANLSGEPFGVGGSFAIGRTWNFSQGQVGGAALSSGEHFSLWQATSSAGSTTSKGTAGVETWRSPFNSGVSWIVALTVRYRP